MEIQDLVLLDGVRPPMAEFGQSFADLSALDLGALAAREVLRRAAIDPEVIDHTFVGNALQTSTDAIYGARHVGELFRARNTGRTLADERRLENYRNWGTDRPNGMDIVGTRHIADVAAYLCGTGSDYACHIADDLADEVPVRATLVDPRLLPDVELRVEHRMAETVVALRAVHGESFGQHLAVELPADRVDGVTALELAVPDPDPEIERVGAELVHVPTVRHRWCRRVRRSGTRSGRQGLSTRSCC